MSRRRETRDRDVVHEQKAMGEYVCWRSSRHADSANICSHRLQVDLEAYLPGTKYVSVNDRSPNIADVLSNLDERQ